MSSFPPRIFLLSPARLNGKRAHLLFHPVTMFPVARALRSTAGAPIGEIFTFLSGLYFRGKLAYAEAFARPPQGLNSGVFVITPNGGLLAPSVRVTLDDLARLAKTDIDPSAKEFRKPRQKDAKALAHALGPRGEPILLGSIATRKYVDVLLAAFPQALLFPAEFVGRGDHAARKRGGGMARGGAGAAAREGLSHRPSSSFQSHIRTDRERRHSVLSRVLRGAAPSRLCRRT